MFEWLEQEILEIKTPKFHMVDGPADEKLRDVVIHSSGRLPRSYKKFVLKFGNAKLYRSARNHSYLIGVFGAPREVMFTAGRRAYHLGFHDSASVFVKPTSRPAESPVFEFALGSEERVGDDFATWLRTSCALARKTYGKAKWSEILRGPEPFTPEEEELVEARRHIHWRVIGIDQAGDHIFEVTNNSTRTLPLLTVGLRSKDRRLDGAIRLKIRHICPGETAVLHADCYKELIPPHEIEAFSLPDPRPEDREFYHELTSVDE